MFADYIYPVFQTVFQMSLVSSVAIVIVLLARVGMRAFPKSFTYMLWSVVLFRLLCPVSFYGSYSVFGLFEETDEGQSTDKEEEAAYYILDGDTIVLPTEQVTENLKGDSIKEITHEYVSMETGKKMISKEAVISGIWFMGMSAVLGYGVYSYISLRKKLASAVKRADGSYGSDLIQTSFVFGVFAPKIYLPSYMETEKLKYVLLHEKIHIRRGDAFFRILAYIALAVHWFNPLVWVAFYVSETDMELSCDEMVLKRAGKDIRRDYASVLLEMAAGKEILITGIPAFGKNQTKKRLQFIADYRQKTVALGVLGGMVVIMVILALAANPEKKEETGIKEENTGQAEEAKDLNGAVGTDSNESAFVKEQLEKWAEAFCSRDGETILAMSSSDVHETYVEEMFMEETEDSSSFGWSSPWPWNEKTDYAIYMQDDAQAGISYYDSNNAELATDVMQENRAEILYYAKTSDPHVTVWAEEVEFETGGEAKEEDFKIISSKITFLDSIGTMEEYLQAYGRGIDNTPMDYEFTSMGKELHVNAWNHQDREEYQALFFPETAAVSLLNLASDDMVYSCHTIEKGCAMVTLRFPLSEGEGGNILLNVKMIQPYGDEGIWVPKDYDDSIVTSFDLGTYEFYKRELGEDFLEQYYENPATIADAENLNGNTIEVYIGNIGDGESGYVFVKDKNQKIIFYEFAHQARANWNMIFYSPKGYFMNVVMEDRDTYGEYRYVVYRVVNEGVLQILAKDVFSFDTRDEDREPELVSFMNELFRYMDGSELLLSSQEGEIRALGLTEKENLTFESVFEERDWHWWKEVMEKND